MPSNERAAVICHCQQLRPLLLVESDRKAAEAIDGHRAFLPDLERQAFGGSAFEGCILSSEPFQFCL
jgi:hypothetical protein